MKNLEPNNFKPLLLQYNNSGSVLKINLNDYTYTCGDGCCHYYEMITTVNGIELPCRNTDIESILCQVLEHLGYKVEITFERTE